MLIPTVSFFFSYFSLVSKFYELNVFKLCNTFETCPAPQTFIFIGLLVLSFVEGSVLAFVSDFSFFLVWKLHKSGLKVIHLIYKHFRILDSVDIGGLVVAYFVRSISTFSHFFSCLFIGIYEKRKSNHYLLILASCSCLEMTLFWFLIFLCQVCKLNYFGQYLYWKYPTCSFC